jgi:hypothetical protein
VLPPCCDCSSLNERHAVTDCANQDAKKIAAIASSSECE